MKDTFIRYSLIVLLIGLGALGAGRADAQHPNWIEVHSVSWGIVPGQTVRTSIGFLGFDPTFVGGVTVAGIQLLDTEGEVVAQSGEIRVEPGKIRYWDAPYEQIGGGREPGTGRLQLRARILFEERSFDPDRPLYNPFITVEVVDSGTDRTSMIWHKLRLKQEFP